ncbi:MAG: hypothetical protein KBS52_03960 [Clostridiales bacterium]|nr:hypothetical protein [Candidatus Equinaster intestinalis]
MNNISVSYLFKLLLRRLYVVIIAGVVFAAAAFSYCHWLATPVYSASAQLIISNGAVIAGTIQYDNTNSGDVSRVATTDIQASMYLSEVCNQLLKSPEMYKKLATSLDNKYTHTDLAEAFSVSLTGEESVFINISCKSISPEEAVQNANAFLALAPDFLKSYIPEAKALPTAQAEKASQVSPKTVQTTALMFIVGAVIAYAIFLIIELNDRTVKGEANFSENFNIPILGAVPDFENPENNKGGYEYAYSGK